MKIGKKNLFFWFWKKKILGLVVNGILHLKDNEVDISQLVDLAKLDTYPITRLKLNKKLGYGS